MYILYFSIFIK